jgi:hypothetical protein
VSSFGGSPDAAFSATFETTATPEPVSMTLLGTGLAGLAGAAGGGGGAGTSRPQRFRSLRPRAPTAKKRERPRNPRALFFFSCPGALLRRALPFLDHVRAGGDRKSSAGCRPRSAAAAGAVGRDHSRRAAARRPGRSPPPLSRGVFAVNSDSP